MRKNLPNFLSVLRIGLAILLVPLAGFPVVFVALYLLCGITDVLDGTIARRWQLESSLGAKLDSLGDFVFSTACLLLLLLKTDLPQNRWLLVALAVILCAKAAGLLLTRLKFRQWGSLHTLLSKGTGLLLFVFIPLCVVWGSIPVYFWVPLAVLALCAALEEILILLASRKYDLNRKSIFSKPNEEGV